MTTPTYSPVTSGTIQPGFVPNVGDPNAPGYQATTLNHSSWVDSMVKYYAALWANGARDNMPVGLDISRLDSNDKNGFPSPYTMLNLTQFFQNYQPTGQNPSLDSTWIPPGPNDYKESAAVTSARIANEQFQQEQDRLEREFGIQQDQVAKTAAINAFNNAFQNELTKYATQVGLWNDQVAAQLNAYNTSAGIYNNQESNRSSNLREAGTLANSLQGLYDKRTENAINLQANPNDFVQREYAVRALNGPIAKDVPGYQNVDALGQVIDRLINYTPASAPQAPVSANPDNQPQLPTAPSQQNFQLPGPLASAINQQSQQQPPMRTQPVHAVPQAPPVQNNLVSGAQPTTGQLAHDYPGSYILNGVLHDAQGHYSTDNGQTWTQDNGQATPQYSNSPLAGTSGTMNNPAGSQPYSPGAGQTAYYNKYTGTYGPKPPGNIPGLAQGSMGTAARKFIAGDPQADGMVNPEVVEIQNPGKKTRAKVTPLKGMSPMKRAAYAYGTPMYGDGTAAPNVTLKSYDDTAYQNFPSLAYLQGNQTADVYNTLKTGTAGGAFGTAIPESGSINYKRYLDIARDPVSLANTASLYSSANRNLAAEVARAKARAPFGQAISTSLIKT